MNVKMLFLIMYNIKIDLSHLESEKCKLRKSRKPLCSLIKFLLLSFKFTLVSLPYSDSDSLLKIFYV